MTMLSIPATAIGHGGIQVTLDTTCRVCEGSGRVYSDQWREWNDRYTAIEAAIASDETRTFDTNQGGKRIDPELRELEANMPGVSEEESCGRCEGSGREPTEIGRQLLAFITTHRGAA